MSISKNDQSRLRKLTSFDFLHRQQASSELKKKKKLKDTEEKEKEKEGSQTEDESVAESVSADENSEEMEGIVPKIEPEEEKKDLTEGQELHLGGGEGESEESSEIRVDEGMFRLIYQIPLKFKTK